MTRQTYEMVVQITTPLSELAACRGLVRGDMANPSFMVSSSRATFEFGRLLTRVLHIGSTRYTLRHSRSYHIKYNRQYLSNYSHHQVLMYMRIACRAGGAPPLGRRGVPSAPYAVVSTQVRRQELGTSPNHR